MFHIHIDSFILDTDKKFKNKYYELKLFDIW